MDEFVKRQPLASHDGGTAQDSPSRDPSLERPSKRAKREETDDSDSETCGRYLGAESARDQSRKAKVGITSDEALDSKALAATDFEIALPPSQSNQEAAEAYEAFKSSQASAAEGGVTAATRPLWIKGRSSIYVDAFNLALDTVLEDESELFDETELGVFNQWKDLDYEAQFLYVRLFLRKTAAWHRLGKLGYYADVSNPEGAMASLQKLRELPQVSPAVPETPNQGVDVEEFALATAFTFADGSEDHIQAVEEAASLLNLEELKGLAKEAKIQGRTKAELIKNLSRMSQQQAGLMSLGLSRHNSRESTGSEDLEKPRTKVKREDSNREKHFMDKIMDILGPCIRLSQPALKLFERVHLVFYRSTEWTEKSLTTIILAKISRRTFPDYIVCRTSTIFASRLHLLEFEAALRLEGDVDNVLEFNGPPGEAGFNKVIEIFEQVYPRWKTLVQEETYKEQKVYDLGEGAYLRRFTPAHSYTRIIHKAISVFARLKDHAREHKLLTELLDQKLFHLSRRGSWYQRKALLEEHYMFALHDLQQQPLDQEQRKKHWRKIAAETCETGLQDPNCHLIHHYDLQKRLTKLEKKLRIPRRLQHDFGHVRLKEPLEVTVEGIQLKKDLPVKVGNQQASTKTIWLDELDSGGECSVEELCLSHFRSHGWKGYHSEGGIVRTLFAYLFYDILFLYIPNVFQTAYQTCPLDLHTDAFFPARASEINHRLVAIANGEGERILRGVWQREHEKRTSVVGLNWDFDVEDLAELVRCFDGAALAAVCRVMAQEYRQRGGGVPDLVLWKAGDESTGEPRAGNETAKGEAMFVEVKSANDRLSDTQRLWIHVLTGAGVKVALCNVLAKEVREVD